MTIILMLLHLQICQYMNLLHQIMLLILIHNPMKKKPIKGITRLSATEAIALQELNRRSHLNQPLARRAVSEDMAGGGLSLRGQSNGGRGRQGLREQDLRNNKRQSLGLE